MADKKYSKYVIPFDFKNDRPGFYRQVAAVSGQPFGLEFNIEYGAYWAAGNMGTEPPRPHTHDYNQVMLWLGGDGHDMGELGAEVELNLGEEGETYMITSSSAVAVPAGLQHYPAAIARMSRRFIYMEVSTAAACSMKTRPALKNRQEPGTGDMWKSKYQQNITNIPFARKGPWSYGARNRDDSGGYLAFISPKDPAMFEYLIMCESIKKAPYRFGPIPDKPHIHPKPEILCFMGTNVNDLSQFDGEAEIALGKEAEVHTITRPTAVVIPGGFPHCPLTITRADRPIILTDVRPFGSEAPSSKKP
ncbi:MAG: hypothetical protein WC370_09390 [Dehalococcoidales bacterium]|jgi:hypothetical protein